MYWLIGLVAAVGVLGYLAVKKTESAVKQLGQNLASSLSSGATMMSTTLTSSSAQGDQGQFTLLPGETFVINVFSAPAGYVWKFDGGGVMTLASTTTSSATLASPATPPTTPFTVYANLLKAGATVSPMATYKFNMQYQPATPTTPPQISLDTTPTGPDPGGEPRPTPVGVRTPSKSQQNIIRIHAATPKGIAASQVVAAPTDLIAVYGYAPPAGYKWMASSDVLTPAAAPPRDPAVMPVMDSYPIGFFTIPANVTSANVQVILAANTPPPVDPVFGGAGGAVQAVLPPIAIYKFPVVVGGAGA